MSLRLQTAELRARKGWTQSQLADAAHVSRATINRIERRSPRRVDCAVLANLAKALGVAPGRLIVRVR